MANKWLRYDGGYLPIKEFVQAVIETGFRGWLSIEVFDGRFEEKYGDDLRRFATKAMDACKRIMIQDNPS
jgi:sugar phosphate isomerase/epimerase